MPSRPIEMSDLLALKTVADPQLSPDGSRIAYTLSAIEPEADDYRSNVWVTPSAGGEPVQFTRGGKRDHSPRWSPDGAWLAFLSDRAGDVPQLYLMPAHGGEARKLTALDNGAGPAVWSPDGKRIAFAARVLKDARPSDSEARKRWEQRPKVITRSQYKADGQGYIFDATSHLFVIDAASGDIKQITHEVNDDRAPSWSPDGRQLAFSRTREGLFEYSLSDIWTINADGTHARRITENVGRALSPSWSPDGHALACYGLDEQAFGMGDPMIRVWHVPLDGRAPRNLTQAADKQAVALPPPNMTPGPVWSNDGRNVSFLVADAGNTTVARVSTDGAFQLLEMGERQITAASMNAALGKIAFVATQPDNPNDVYVCDWNGVGEKRLTRVNEALLSQVSLPRVERRQFKDPHGGRPLDGWLVHPMNTSGPAPLLLDIHGGPASFHGNNFMFGYFYRYVLPQRGWAILLLNPTGSGSYGRDFAHGIRARWGEYDLPQHQAALDALVAEGIADGNKLAVTGYSYGGYMTSWTIGHTNRFKAAVIGAPVVNYESFYGTSDIGPWFGTWEMGGDIFAARETFRRLSPINYVDQAATPALILHGEADDRCPIGQGEEMYYGLLARGKAPTEFVKYPGGSHLFIVSGRPSHRVDYGQRLMAWVEKYALGNEQ